MKRRRDFLIFSFGLMILVASLRAPSVGIDLAGHYAKRFEQIAFYSWKDIPKFSAFSTYEIGYCYYCKILSMINSNVQFYIFVTSLIVYGTMGYLIYKKSSDVILSTMLVIFSCQYYMYMNIIRQGFKAVHEYLVNGGKSCMAGFVLKNTLPDNGGVTRGICKMDEENNLTEVVETKNIVKTADGAEADGKVIDVGSLVSMNMWGLTPDFLDVLEKGFKEFFEKEVPCNPLKAEYLIPIFIGELLEQGKMSVKVLKTNDTWYGMTYHEDVAAVKDSFKKMLEKGLYKADLFSDQ